MAFDFRIIPFINNSEATATSLTLHPGLIWDVGHNFAVGVRAAYDINAASWIYAAGAQKLPFKGEHSFFKAYFVEAIYQSVSSGR